MWGALAVLVGSLVPLLIQLRKPGAESEYLLARMNAELPLLLKEMRATMESLNALVEHGVMGSSLQWCCFPHRLHHDWLPPTPPPPPEHNESL